MRELKFRGKSTYLENEYAGTKWIFGDLVICALARMVDEKRYYIHDGVSSYPVSNSSIGEYTGIKDSNGVKIYEGDIVSDTSGLFIRAQVRWHNENLAWGLLTLGNSNYSLAHAGAFDTLEVIGNIHDNPELLEN